MRPITSTTCLAGVASSLVAFCVLWCGFSSHSLKCLLDVLYGEHEDKESGTSTEDDDRKTCTGVILVSNRGPDRTRRH